ncbi:MAG: PAS domain-containing sensor histidine kinase [Cyanobacteriota bacterium]|nr:PAS domain-containing sensor histidine kinase [Cyanobacteriota bacterium]
MGLASRGRSLVVPLMTVGAVLLNLHSPTIFFDNQVLLGSGLGVLALLQFGAWGLPVGLAAALTTLPLWGHPYQAVTLIGLLLWQWAVLRRGRYDRLLTATMAYWLLIGLPLHQLLYTTLMQASGGTALALGLKESVVSVVTTALALLLHLSFWVVGPSDRQRHLSIRHISFAALLTAISVPAVLIILLMGQQLTAIQLQEEANGLRLRAEDLLFHGLSPYTYGQAEPVATIELLGPYAFAAVDHRGRQVSSDPELFAQLERDFRHEAIPTPSGLPLELLVRRQGESRLQQLLNGYWCFHLAPTAPDRDEVWQEITLVHPARERINHLQGLMRTPLLVLAVLLVLAALLAEVLAGLAAAPFEQVLAILQQPAEGPDAAAAPPMPWLPFTRLHELNTLVAALNSRAAVVNELSRSLLSNNRLLRLSERRHRLLADSALDLIVLLTAEGHPTYVSPSIRRLRGYSPMEAMALPLRRQLRPSGHRQVMAALRRMRQAQGGRMPMPSFRLELEQRHRNGSWLPTDVTITAIADDDGTNLGILVICRDQGERLRLEARRREQLEQKLRSSLTAAAAGHEMSQPLATLQLANRLMRQTLQNSMDPQRVHQELEALLELQHEAGEAALDTIDVMRRLLRTPSRPSRVVDLAALASSVLRQTRSTGAIQGVVLMGEGLEQACLIQGDGGQIEVALSNLLANALQAVAQRPQGERQVRLALHRHHAWVELRVDDSGPGLPADLLEQLPLCSTRAGGTGLGLYLVRVMLENHGGTWEAMASPLGGACLCLRLPATSGADLPAAGDGHPAITVA